jgi:uncharacterized protein YuzE
MEEKEIMIYEYDNEVDILTIRFRDEIQPGEIADSEEFDEGLIAENALDGNLIQLELRNARRIVSGQSSVTSAKAA